MVLNFIGYVLFPVNNKMITLYINAIQIELWNVQY